MFHHISRLPIDYTGISIFCFGDLQFGCQGFDEAAWAQFRDEFKSTPNAYAIGLGDYEDWLRPSMRGRIEASLSHDDSARQQLDDKIRKSQDSLLNRLQFLEGKIILLHQGHHDWKFSSGEYSSQRLASALKAPFGGWTASTRVSFYYSGRKYPKRIVNATDFVYTIISTHGNANARLTSSSTRWMENSLVHGFVADQYIMGHGCKSASWTPNEVRMVRRSGAPGTKDMTPRCLMVGGFHNGFTNGWESTYVEKAGFLPQPVMWGVIRFRIKSSLESHRKLGVPYGRHTTKHLDVECVSRGVSGHE